MQIVYQICCSSGTILIADDHEIVRTGLANVIDYEDGLSVVGVARNGQVAVQLAAREKPDVVIMDLMMPVMGGVEATEKIAAVAPESRVLILTTYGTPEELQRARNAGAAGIIMKSATNKEIIRAARHIAAGETVIPPSIERLLASEPEVKLTDRQIEILQSVTRGLSNQDIALQFGITLAGVKKHMTTIYEKLGVANRAEAVTTALRKQLLKT